MKEISDLHKEAMHLADQAHLERLRNRPDRASSLFREAFDKERQAASLTGDRLEMEPTRSVLHRSAASLAIDCGQTREAERLIGRALAGNPPDEIADELRDLLEQVNFLRHLAIRGFTLETNEFQISISGGSAVAYGFAKSQEFVERVNLTETLLYRIVERKLKRPFREGGRRAKELKEEIELYVSVPRAASLAVSFRLGSSDQLKLPGMDRAAELVDEALDCLDLLNQRDMTQLKARIEDEAYYRNFVALARGIAPDGERIRTVGYTAFRHGKERHVLLSTPRKNVPEAEPLKPEVRPVKRVEVRGILRFADARRAKQGLIQIIDENKHSHRVRVPSGMMGDIVRPMFEYEVVLIGREEEGIILLDNIEMIY